jgi:hypothetical protein
MKFKIYSKAKKIDGFDNYIITNDGAVFSLIYNKLLKPSRDSNGYLGLTICNGNGLKKKMRVHRLVATIFIENPENLPCVRHLNGNKEDNSVGNLAWGTYKQNENDKKACGTWETRYNGKLSRNDILVIRKMRKDGASQLAIAKIFKVSRPTITRLLNGKTWSHL